MYYVYILELSDKSIYIDYSEDLKSRFKEHQYDNVDTTKNKLPVKLVNYTAFTDKFKALKYERYLKEGSGAAFRNKHLI